MVQRLKKDIHRLDVCNLKPLTVNEIPNKFAVDFEERQYRLPTMYWLPNKIKK